MEKLVISATSREVIGKHVKKLRREGKLPGIIYGHNIDPTPILMNLKDATKALQTATASSLINLDIDGTVTSVLVREKQRDFIKGNYLHVDFQAVSTTEKLKAKVGIVLTGTAPAIKDFDGILVTGLEQIEVECFPQDLPEDVKIDISTLTEIGHAIYVKDLPAFNNVTVLDHPEELVVIVTAPKVEAEPEVVEAVEAVEEPEIIEKGKKEEASEEDEK